MEKVESEMIISFFSKYFFSKTCSCLNTIASHIQNMIISFVKYIKNHIFQSFIFLMLKLLTI
jgi:hypothetical protein